MQDPQESTQKSGDPVGAQAERAFARNMRALREELGVSQAALARKLENVGIQLDSTAVTRIEKHADGSSGMRTIRLSEAVAIAQVLNTTLSNMVLPARSTVFEQLLQASDELEEATDSADTAIRQREDAEEKVRILQSRFVEREVPSAAELTWYTAHDLDQVGKSWSEVRESFKDQRTALAKREDTGNSEALFQLEEKELICLDVLYRVEDATKKRLEWRALYQRDQGDPRDATKK